MPTTMLSLPMETLREIIDYAVHEYYAELDSGPRDWAAIIQRRQTGQIQKVFSKETLFSLRLVNKRFYNVASHLLLPVLRIRLDETSLQRAEEISNVSQVAAGIREVELILPYCPDNLASDLQTFIRFKIDQFDDMEEKCRSYLLSIADDSEYEEYLEKCFELDEDSLPSLEEMTSAASDEDEMAKQAEQEWVDETNFIRASKKWLAVREAWEGAALQETHKHTSEADHGILRKGFELFRAVHRKQHHLVTTGTFATRLGAILFKLGGAESLCFKDETSDLTDEAKYMRFVETLLDADSIMENLTEPMPWSTACLVDAGPEKVFATITAAALLWDVPVALHRAGVSIRKLSIQCFTGDRKFELEIATNGYLNGKEAEFRDGLSSLYSFQFSPKRSQTGIFLTDLEAFTVGREYQIINYLRLCTSSAQLRVLHISFEHFRCMTMKLNKQDELLLSLADVLESMGSTRLHKIQVEYASVTQAGVLGMCERLGPETSCVLLNQLNLQSGNWAGVLDALRSAIGPDVAQGRCRFSMANFDSAELERYYKASDSLRYLIRGKLVDIMRMEDVFEEVWDYVAGGLNENPLSRYQEHLE